MWLSLGQILQSCATEALNTTRTKSHLKSYSNYAAYCKFQKRLIRKKKKHRKAKLYHLSQIMEFFSVWWTNVFGELNMILKLSRKFCPQQLIIISATIWFLTTSEIYDKHQLISNIQNCLLWVWSKTKSRTPTTYRVQHGLPIIRTQPSGSILPMSPVANHLFPSR